MKLKSAGIVTMYHASRNYGGLLQSFALCHYLRSNGVDAQQIDLPAPPSAVSAPKRILNYGFITIIKKVASKARNVLVKGYMRVFRGKMVQNIKRRDEELDEFRESKIPNICTVKSSENLCEYNKCFEGFICGSDQIWNPYAFRSEYFLDFVEEGKIRFAYAASIAKKSISLQDGERIVRYARNLKAVSVREKMSQDILKKIGIENSEVVLDPVFLLEKQQWEAFLQPQEKRTPYLFYYMLEGNYRSFSMAKKYAKELGMELVMIPGLVTANLWIDAFGKYSPHYCGTPFEFIELIRNADLIITDSFHASAFSCIFEKEALFVECRETQTLLPRIELLLDALDCKDHYFDSYDLQRAQTLSRIDYAGHKQNVNVLIDISKGFIERNIGA